MLDAGTAGRAAQRATDSAILAGNGYAEAMMAAYIETMSAGIEFWTSALLGLPLEQRRPEPAFGRSREDFSGIAWFDTARTDAWSKLMFPLTPFDVWNAWASSVVPLRGAPAAWPSAMAMIDAGVPRSVAWPVAEANAAVIDATIAASEPVRDAMASSQFAAAHGGSGFAMTHFGRTRTPDIVSAWAAIPGAGVMLAMWKPFLS